MHTFGIGGGATLGGRPRRSYYSSRPRPAMTAAEGRRSVAFLEVADGSGIAYTFESACRRKTSADKGSPTSMNPAVRTSLGQCLDTSR